MIPNTRIAGSGYTVLLWQNSPLAYLQTIQDTPPQPVAGAQVVQPMDARTPLEIVTSGAVGAGTLRGTFYERWIMPVWQTLPGLEGTNNLLEVLERQMFLGAVNCQKIIRNAQGTMRAYVYHDICITDVDPGEQVNVGTMTLPKTVTMQYTQVTGI